VRNLKQLLLFLDPHWHPVTWQTSAQQLIWSSALFDGRDAGFWYGLFLIAFHRWLRQQKEQFLRTVWLGIIASFVSLWLNYIMFAIWIKPRMGNIAVSSMPFAHWLGGWFGYLYGLLEWIAATMVSSLVGAYVYRRLVPRQGSPTLEAQATDCWPPKPKATYE
jgi:hypothetical protein